MIWLCCVSAVFIAVCLSVCLSLDFKILSFALDNNIPNSVENQITAEVLSVSLLLENVCSNDGNRDYRDQYSIVFVFCLSLSLLLFIFVKIYHIKNKCRRQNRFKGELIEGTHFLQLLAQFFALSRTWISKLLRHLNLQITACLISSNFEYS